MSVMLPSAYAMSHAAADACTVHTGWTYCVLCGFSGQAASYY